MPEAGKFQNSAIEVLETACRSPLAPRPCAGPHPSSDAAVRVARPCRPLGCPGAGRMLSAWSDGRARQPGRVRETLPRRSTI